MADRSLRGVGIGAKSLESESGVELADRQEAHYVCPNGHTVVLPFAAEADVPALWECHCGEEALLRNATRPEPTKPTRKPRTHWDMLLERRSVEELEVLLDERLALLRSGELRRSSV